MLHSHALFYFVYSQSTWNFLCSWLLLLSVFSLMPGCTCKNKIGPHSRGTRSTAVPLVPSRACLRHLFQIS